MRKPGWNSSVTRRAADHGILLEHDDAQAGARKIGSAGQAVVAGADDGNVVLVVFHDAEPPGRWIKRRRRTNLPVYVSIRVLSRAAADGTQLTATTAEHRPRAGGDHGQACTADDRSDDAADRQGCEAAFKVHRLWEAARPRGPAQEVAPGHPAICTGGHTGVKTNDALMARLPNLKIVANFGVGYDSVDAAAAARRGVVVTNTPEVLTEEVADTTLGLLLNTVREFCQAEKWLRDGRWAKDGDYRLTPHRCATARWASSASAASARRSRAALEAFGVPVSYFGRNAAARRELPLLCRSGGPGARRGHADRGDAGRAGDAEPDRRRGAQRARARAAS